MSDRQESMIWALAFAVISVVLWATSRENMFQYFAAIFWLLLAGWHHFRSDK